MRRPSLLCTYMNARSGADLTTSLPALDPTIGSSTGTQGVNRAEQPLVSTDGERVERSHADTEGHEKGHNRAPLESIATPASGDSYLLAAAGCVVAIVGRLV